MIHISEKTLQYYQDVSPTYRKIYKIVRHALLTGELTSEEKVTEEALSLFFNSSRTPVRKALQLIKEEGLLQQPLSKAAIDSKKLSRKEMSDLIDTDALLESYAAALVAKKGISQEELSTLEELNDGLKNLNECAHFESDLLGVRDLHLQFHMMIARISDNKYIYKMIAKTRTSMRIFSSHKPFPKDSSPQNTYRNVIASSHDHIIQAIIRREPEIARAWMYTDVISAKDIYENSYVNPLLIPHSGEFSLF